MKTLTFLILAGLLAFSPGVAMAVVGSATVAQVNYQNGSVRELAVSWTGNSSGGVVPDTTISAANAAFIQGYWLCGAETKSTTPGSRPTDDYDIYIMDASNADDSASNDLFGGALTNRDSNSTEYVVPKMLVGGTIGLGCKFVTGSLKIRISNTTTNSATGVIRMFFIKP